jgi:hypothetical protein
MIGAAPAGQHCIIHADPAQQQLKKKRKDTSSAVLLSQRRSSTWTPSIFTPQATVT